MLAFSIDYYGIFFGATQSVELFCTYTLSKPPYNQLFLEIDDKVLEEIEIVFGPKMSEAEKILAIALIKEYCPQAVYTESVLKIR